MSVSTWKLGGVSPTDSSSTSETRSTAASTSLEKRLIVTAEAVPLLTVNHFE